MAFERIERSLCRGARLRGFLAGSRERVVRIEKKKKLVGYGEATHILEALSQANRKMGLLPIKTIYLPQLSEVSEDFDLWMRQGFEFVATCNKLGVFEVELINRYDEARPPKELIEKAARDGSTNWKWADHVIRIHGVCDHAKKCCWESTVVLRGNTPMTFVSYKTGLNRSLEQAFVNAIKANPHRKVADAA